MDIELKTNAFFLLPGVSPGEVVPRAYRGLVDWLAASLRADAAAEEEPRPT